MPVPVACQWAHPPSSRSGAGPMQRAPGRPALATRTLLLLLLVLQRLHDTQSSVLAEQQLTPQAVVQPSLGRPARPHTAPQSCMLVAGAACQE